MLLLLLFHCNLKPLHHNCSAATGIDLQFTLLLFPPTQRSTLFVSQSLHATVSNSTLVLNNAQSYQG
jgi:hypothetical protein